MHFRRKTEFGKEDQGTKGMVTKATGKMANLN